MPYTPSNRMISMPASAVLDILEAFYDANEATQGQFANDIGQALKDEFVSARQKQLQAKHAETTAQTAGVEASALAEPAGNAAEGDIVAADFTMHTPLADPLLAPEDHAMFAEALNSFTNLSNAIACIRKHGICHCPPGQTCPDDTDGA